MAALNTRAFGYESIRDTQENKEFWVNIAALVVIVGAALIFPPAGIALGAIYGGAELTSAITGKDLVSRRELGTGERWFRGRSRTAWENNIAHKQSAKQYPKSK